jgi:hypothetical protein
MVSISAVRYRPIIQNHRWIHSIAFYIMILLGLGFKSNFALVHLNRFLVEVLTHHFKVLPNCRSCLFARVSRILELRHQ